MIIYENVQFPSDKGEFPAIKNERGTVIIANKEHCLFHNPDTATWDDFDFESTPEQTGWDYQCWTAPNATRIILRGKIPNEIR